MNVTQEEHTILHIMLRTLQLQLDKTFVIDAIFKEVLPYLILLILKIILHGSTQLRSYAVALAFDEVS